jgi:hypothetical protein
MYSYPNSHTSITIMEITFLEIYAYIGLLNGWWFSKHLTPALEEEKVKETKIHWITGIMFLIAWPLMIWRNNEQSARNIAKELKKGQNERN